MRTAGAGGFHLTQPKTREPAEYRDSGMIFVASVFG
jgi:hypothetical protein